MNSTLRSNTLRDSGPFPITTEKWNRQAATRPHKRQTALIAFRRHFDPLTIGFMIGGVAFAMGGCILGICMPYHHPIGVNISMLWWSIFLGIIGAYIGACVGQLFGIWEDHAPSLPPRADAIVHHRQIQATTEVTVRGEPVTNSVLGDEYTDTFVRSART